MALFAIATVAALALQTTLPRLLPFEILVPELTLVLVVDLGLRHRGMLAALAAFAIGYATDAVSGSQLGLNALIFTLVFILTYWLSRAVFSPGRVLGVMAVFGGVLLCALGSNLVSSGWTRPENLALLTPAILIQAALTALCAPAIFATMKSATRLVGLRSGSSRE
ncbi:MAG: rod shape-determining protein MreD [Candidatus Binataceae bacterium]